MGVLCVCVCAILYICLSRCMLVSVLMLSCHFMPPRWQQWVWETFKDGRWFQLTFLWVWSQTTNSRCFFNNCSKHLLAVSWNVIVDMCIDFPIQLRKLLKDNLALFCGSRFVRCFCFVQSGSWPKPQEEQEEEEAEYRSQVLHVARRASQQYQSWSEKLPQSGCPFLLSITATRYTLKGYKL